MVASKTKPTQLTDASGAQMSRESYADILAAWRAKNPLEAEADKRAMPPPPPRSPPAKQ